MEALTTRTIGTGARLEVQIRLFGGVAAATDDGEPVDVGPAKCQAVLAVLALSPGSAVPVSRIVRLVWGDEPPRTADKTLQSYVTRLRKGLGADSIVRTGVAYRLDVTADSVDVVRFQRLLGLDDTEAALAEWTGTPLAGLDADGLTATVDGLVEQYLGVGGDRPGAAHRGRRACGDRLADRADRDLPVPRGALGVVDDGAVPGRPPGRCARRLSQGPRAPRRGPRASNRARGSASWSR